MLYMCRLSRTIFSRNPSRAVIFLAPSLLYVKSYGIVYITSLAQRMITCYHSSLSAHSLREYIRNNNRIRGIALLYFSKILKYSTKCYKQIDKK